jgi:hypothetical protein
MYRDWNNFFISGLTLILMFQQLSSFADLLAKKYEELHGGKGGAKKEKQEKQQPEKKEKAQPEKKKEEKKPEPPKVA